MAGRKIKRKSERLKTQQPIEIQYKGNTIEATTEDLSDEGILFVRDTPCYLPQGETVRITIKADRYTAALDAQVVYVKEQDGIWHYAVSATPIDAEHKRQYFQIVYDRPHSLPTQTDQWSTITDDVKRNICRRLAIAPPQRRKHPRIQIGRTITFACGATAFAHDFNFVCFALSDIRGNAKQMHEGFFLPFSHGIVMELRDTGRTVPSSGARLYTVANHEALHHQGVDLDKVVQELTQ